METEMITVEGLIEIDKKKILDTFKDTTALDKYIKIVRDELSGVDYSLKTDASRKAIGSTAFKATTMKTALVRLANASMEDSKELIKQATLGRKYLESELDKVRDHVREPLTKWEAEKKEKEAKRISEIQESIGGIAKLGTIDDDADKEYIASMIEAVDNIDCSSGFDEFAQDALNAKSLAKEKLSAAIQAIVAKEVEDKRRADFEVKEKLSSLKMIPIDLFGKKADAIKTKLDALPIVSESEFGELHSEAERELNLVKSRLSDMLSAAIETESREAELEASKPNAIENTKEAEDSSPATTATPVQTAPVSQKKTDFGSPVIVRTSEINTVRDLKLLIESKYDNQLVEFTI